MDLISPQAVTGAGTKACTALRPVPTTRLAIDKARAFKATLIGIYGLLSMLSRTTQRGATCGRGTASRFVLSA